MVYITAVQGTALLVAPLCLENGPIQVWACLCSWWDLSMGWNSECMLLLGGILLYQCSIWYLGGFLFHGSLDIFLLASTFRCWFGMYISIVNSIEDKHL